MAPSNSLQILTSGSPSLHNQHNVVSPTQHHREHAHGHDVYCHPEAVAYAVAHPQRTIRKLGPYLILKTLSDGEFSKVKLGLHSQWGDEVAVKLIRRRDTDTSLQMSEVERKIEMLKSLKHPNIVWLFDVIETDKYIGLVLNYASGGNLFQHIVINRHLCEHDAAKLFSQLISGVRYIHQEKIVHRNLKSKNILLDRHRNVVIADFGSANRFEHGADDLMFYVGSLVDAWNCGVMLYTMLTGYYMRFDGNPASLDRKTLTRLISQYKHNMSTPWSFPDYISSEARDLLSVILVPDPKKRTGLEGVMKHPWLAAYREGAQGQQQVPKVFERMAMEQHRGKAKCNLGGLSEQNRHDHTPQQTSDFKSEGPNSSPSPATDILPESSAQPCPDTYFNPSVMAYAAAYPQRTIPRFGPYLILQTLQKTEFGYIKLALHSQWGVEVAVKLIRKRDLDGTLKSMVEREIDVLKTVKHPDLVRLYDVLETDKIIGIILEYPPGGLPEYVYDYAKFEETWAALYEKVIINY